MDWGGSPHPDPGQPRHVPAPARNPFPSPPHEAPSVFYSSRLSAGLWLKSIGFVHDFHCLFGVRETAKQPIPLGGGVKRCSPRAAIPRGPRCRGMREQQPAVPDQNDFYAKRDAGGGSRWQRGWSGAGGPALGSRCCFWSCRPGPLLLRWMQKSFPDSRVFFPALDRFFPPSWPGWARCPFPSLVPTPSGLSFLCSSHQDVPIPNPQIVPRRFYIHL